MRAQRDNSVDVDKTSFLLEIARFRRRRQPTSESCHDPSGSRPSVRRLCQRRHVDETLRISGKTRFQRNSEAAHRLLAWSQRGTPDCWVSQQDACKRWVRRVIAVLVVVALLAKEGERLKKGVIAVIDVLAQARGESKGNRAHKQELQKLQLLLSSSLSLSPPSVPPTHQVAIGTSGAEIFF